jgi:hypothetical protein
MVTVYHAQVGDYVAGAAQVTSQKGTIAWASRLRGMIIPDTAEEVAAWRIDGEGRLMAAQIMRFLSLPPATADGEGGPLTAREGATPSR